MTIIDQNLESQFLAVICKTITTSKNRNDLFILAGELATACTAYTQTNLLSNKKYCQCLDVSKPGVINSKTESVAKSAMFGRPHREKVNLAEKLPVAEPDDVITTTQNNLVVGDNSEIPNDRVADTGKTIDPDQITPVWISKNINLAEYWVYDYSTPCTTMHGNCGGACAQTEIMLVHRRKYKLLIVDAEFVSVDALRDFLDPRKELAHENKIYPLEKIDEELAGNDENSNKNLTQKKDQTRFNQFLETYHRFHGDTAKIATAMNISKQGVYTYKNKAKTMGLLK